MMKKECRNQSVWSGNRSIICMVLFGLIILTLLAVPVTAAKLATPTLYYPPNNFRTYDADGEIFFAWKPVAGATNYRTEIQVKVGSDWVFDSSNDNDVEWYFIRYPNEVIPTTRRWRVHAENGNPAENANPTAWRTFITDIGQGSLGTPVLVGPPSGTNFYYKSNVYGLPRLFEINWKAVPGANRYLVAIEYYDAGLAIWKKVPSSPFTIDGTYHTGYLYTGFPGPFKGRWCVQAVDTTGAWLDSTPSAWRTFTFKN